MMKGRLFSLPTFFNNSDRNLDPHIEKAPRDLLPLLPSHLATLHCRGSAAVVMSKFAKCRELNFKLGRKASDYNGEAPALQTSQCTMMTQITCFNAALFSSRATYLRDVN